ncbi:MAG: dephospho-CoA kinase, partial [Alphaproteobacteria bacterium]
TQKFLRDQQRAGRKIVALDIPLLFETGGEKRVDTVFVVSAPKPIQTQRALARSGMTLEKLNAIRSKQTP